MELITLLISSASVSAIVTFSLRFFLENKQKQKFNEKLEELKADLQKQQEVLKSNVEIEKELTLSIKKKKLEVYPKVCELVYRLRNLSREILNNKESEVISEETKLRNIEIEEFLFEYRIYLENDNIFRGIHLYKNLLSLFLLMQSDYSRLKNDSDRAELARTMEKMYSLIDHNMDDIITLINKRLEEVRKGKSA